MQIREYCESDWSEVWSILNSVFKDGATFPNNPDTSETDAKKFWVNDPRFTFVAVLNDKVVGSYHIKNNQIGLGSHVANAGYVVSPDFRGRGVGLLLGRHSLKLATRYGYLAMQFNLVVSTNSASIALWLKLGFHVIGTIPNGFNHSSLGLVDAYIMFRNLS